MDYSKTTWYNGDLITAEKMNKIENQLEELSAIDTHITGVVETWLDDHPEATTTVQDNSLTINKFTKDTKFQTIKDYVTPEMFGAEGDGITDDTLAIQTAINVAKTGTIRRVVFQAKTYRVTGTISLEGCICVDLIGATTMGRTDAALSSTRLIYDGQGDCIEINGSYNCQISGLSIWHAQNDDDSVAIHYIGGRCRHNRISDCEITGFNTGVLFETGTAYDTLYNTYFSNCHKSVIINHTLEDVSEPIECNYIYVEHCGFSYKKDDLLTSDVVGIEIDAVEYLYVEKCDFVDGIGVRVRGLNAENASYQLHDLYFRGNIFFQCETSAEILRGVQRIDFSGNTHRLGYNPGSKALTITGTSSRSCTDVRIDDIIQYFRRENINFPYMDFDYILGLKFDCKIPYNENISGDTGGGVFPMRIGSNSRVVFSDTAGLVSAPVYKTLAAGASEVYTFKNSRFNWLQPLYQIQTYGSYNISAVTCAISHEGRNSILTLTNSGQSEARLIIKPIYAQG